MKIVKLVIEKLFGIYSYHIDFASDEFSLKLITGPNGYGKTTILKIVSALQANELYYFYKLRFTSIAFVFDDSSKLEIIQQAVNNDRELADNQLGDMRVTQSNRVDFFWKREDGEVARFSYNENDIRKVLGKLRYDMDTPREIQREIQHKNWSSPLLDEFLLHSEVFNNLLVEKNGQSGFMMQLQLIRSAYIPANRIYQDAFSTDSELPIEHVVDKIRDKLGFVKMKYFTESVSDDSKFIKEILANRGLRLSEEEYLLQREKLQKLVTKFAKYVPISIDIPEYSEKHSDILSYYINRLVSRFEGLNKYIDKFSLFDAMLREKSFSNKKVTFSPHFGMRIESVTGEFIDVTLLSSGEQHEVVLLYNLIFEVPDSSILLVDEPENSLHVAWQQMIISDLMQIAKIKKLQLIVATHSPTIVSYGSDYAVDLFYLDTEESF